MMIDSSVREGMDAIADAVGEYCDHVEELTVTPTYRRVTEPESYELDVVVVAIVLGLRPSMHALRSRGGMIPVVDSDGHPVAYLTPDRMSSHVDGSGDTPRSTVLFTAHAAPDQHREED